MALTWQLRRFHGFDNEATGHEMVAEDTTVSPDVEPGDAADALAMTAVDSNGREVWTWV